MAFVLNEEQRQFQDSISDFLAKEAPIAALRKIRDEERIPAYDTELWQQFVDMGLTAISVPEEFGGLGFGLTGMGILTEQIGRNLTASPLMASNILAADLLKRFAAEPLQQDVLPRLASGERTVAVAADESQHFRPLQTATTATRNGADFVLSGVKQFVPDGSFADSLVVLARTAGAPGDANGLSLFWIDDASQAGIERHSVRMMDSRDYAEIRLRDIPVPEAALLGGEGDGTTVVERLTDVAGVIYACELLGIAQECLDRTVEYLKEREQFGVHIGSFQALQHRAAQMYIKVEMLRSVVLDALAAFSAKRPDASLSASHAKAMAIEVSSLVGAEAIQMHGGIGVTDDLDIGLFYKRSVVLRNLYGNRSYHTERFARLSGF